MKAKDFVFEDETLVKYTGNGGDIIIPDGTVQIGNGWQWDTNFRDLEDINTISIPDSVERICDGAFRFTKALKKIEIPKSVKEIGRSAFWNCDNLSEVYIYGDDIKAYGKVFEDCSALTKIVAPNLPLNTFSEPEVKLIMLRGYLEESDKYDEAIANQYIKYLISQRKKLVPELMKVDCLKAIRILADKKKIDASNFENEYFSPASAANAVQCVAFLLEWKNQNSTYDASMDLGDLEIIEKPITLTELKKLWSFDEIETDSIILTDYKGEEENVVIPKMIGNKTVVGLGDYIFSSDKESASPNVRSDSCRPILQRMLSKAATW